MVYRVPDWEPFFIDLEFLSTFFLSCKHYLNIHSFDLSKKNSKFGI